MSEAASPAATPDDAPVPQSAGAMLRAAREKQGLHIAALAAAIKVTPAKLDALEQGRFQELPDATFTRALAQSVCRVLKIDAAPVLERLPAAAGVALEKVDAGLNTPFRDRPGRIDPTEWTLWRQPVVWVVLVLLAAAAAFLFLPPLKLPALGAGDGAATVPASAASAAAVDLPASATATAAVAVAAAAALPASVQAETVHSAPPVAEAASAASPAYLLVLRADEPSWVEVLDARGQSLFSRTVVPGESVGIDGSAPLKVRIGNAGATRLLFRGQAVDLAAVTRDNVARLELK